MIEVYWDNDEQTIIRLDYTDPIVDWDEYRSAVKKCYDMIEQISHIVNIIHNTGNAKMPSGNPFKHLQHAMYNTPSNTGCITMVITNWFARRMTMIVLQTFVRNYHGSYHWAKSLDEAYEILQTD
jgi:hypothetical protein